MTDVWELAAYVEAHPDNHKQRWRLAKKLYTSWEYRLALEHLLVLRNETEPRENVMRYLAATYYRLGRHDESIATLEAALGLWPNDLGMIEQLARTQGEANYNEDALKSWKQLAEKATDHPFAKQAVVRYTKIVAKEAKEKTQAAEVIKANTPGAQNGTEPDSGTPPKEVQCPQCGQKNSAEFKRCWKCNAALTHSEDFLDDMIKRPEHEEPARMPLPMVTGILIAGLLALGVFLALQGIAKVDKAADEDLPLVNVGAFMDSALLWTRVILGAVLLVGWPLAWRLAAYLMNVDAKIYNETLYRAGALCALAVFALLWLPWKWIAAAVATPVLLSAAIALLFFKLDVKPALKVWFAQLTIAAVLVATVIVGRHGPGLLIDAPRIAAYAKESGTREPHKGYFVAPGKINVQWRSSGSGWLDRHASSVRLSLHAPHERRMFLDTIENGKTLSFEQLSGDDHVEDRHGIQIGVPYVFDVRSDDAVETRYTLQSLLPFTVEPTVGS